MTDSADILPRSGFRWGSAQKGFMQGTHRTVPPDETLARVEPLLPVMGITRVCNVTGLDQIGLPVVMVTRPNSRSMSVAQGKGLSMDAAKASGIMEAIESYHAEHITLSLKLGSYEDLRYQYKLVDVTQLPRRSDSAFKAFKQILWIEAEDLIGGEPTWVPYELVHLDYSLPLPSGHGCFSSTSNGLASGNHAAEAVCHGLSEVIERDATTLWHLLDPSRQAATGIDLETVDDPGCRAALARFEAANVAVAAWETTSDVGVPAFLCRIVDRAEDRARSLRPAAGMGCHPDKGIALLRALTEAAQSRLTFISGARDDLDRDGYRRFLDPEAQDDWRRTVTEGVPARNFQEVVTRNSNSLANDIDWMIGRLKSIGIEQVLAVDLTKPEIGLPVVRIVVPGLEGVDGSTNYLHGARARLFMEQPKWMQ